MDFAVAYTTDEAKIGTALQAGRIDSGDMVLVIDSADDIYGHLVIIDKNNQEVKVSTSMRKFASKADATQWLNKTVNKPVGEIVSIRTGDTYKLNIVNTTAGGGYDFTEVSGGGGGVAGVTSVNGKTGDVTITTDDIPAGTVSEVFTVADKTALEQAINNITLIQNNMFNKNGDTMTGNINMDGHDISNIQRIHVNGNAPLYIGSTIEPAGTQGTRITGTTAGEISFVKADTQNTLNNINVGEPTNASHAATKNYVDNAIANNSPVKSVNTKTGDVVLNAGDVGAVAITGGTMTGNLILNAAPTANNGAATKKYVDDSVAAAGNVPPSTVADQGKVLTVDAAGVAAWASANSDAVLVVGFTEAGGIISADKTVAEIVAEHAKSKEVIGVLNDNVFQLIDATANHVEFTSATTTGIVSLSATTGSVFTKAESEFVTGAEPTVAEAGKVLIVNAQGKAEWTDMPDGKFMLITITRAAGNVLSADKTYTEIKDAIDNGITTVVKDENDYLQLFNVDDFGNIQYRTAISTSGVVQYLYFTTANNITSTSETFVKSNYGIAEANKILVTNATGMVTTATNPVPTIVAADDGKFLVAKADGTTEWVEIPESKYMLITVTLSGAGNRVDKSYAEIKAAIDAGQLTILTCEGKYYNLSSVDTTTVTYTCVNQKKSYNITIGDGSLNTDFIDLAGMAGWNANNQGQTLVIDGTGRLTTNNAYPVPSAAAVDQGKVLTVSATGTPEWNELDSKVKLITVTENGGNYSSDTTYADIKAAIDSGANTVVKYGSYYFNLISVETTYVLYSRSDNYTIFTISVNSTNRVGYNTYPLQKTKYTAADAGKILGVGATGSVTLLDKSDVSTEGCIIATATYIGNDTFTLDKTYAELYDAFLNKHIMVYINNGGSYYPLTMTGNNSLDFDLVQQSGEFQRFEVSSTNTVRMLRNKFARIDNWGTTNVGKVIGVNANGELRVLDGVPVPTAQAADQGKVLIVNAQGNPEWIESPSLPAGGTANQVLTKIDGTDYNYEWKSVSALPAATAANEGQYLTVDAAGAAKWSDAWDCGEIQ